MMSIRSAVRWSSATAALWALAAVAGCGDAASPQPSARGAALLSASSQVGDNCGSENPCFPASQFYCDPGSNTCQTCDGGLVACSDHCTDLDSLWCGAGNSGQCFAQSCSCPSDWQTCSGTCSNPASDSANCGACGHACASTEQCSAGQCVPTPPSPTCSGVTYCDCGLWVPTGQACPAVSCNPCSTGMTYCGCGVCVQDGTTCPAEPTTCPGRTCPSAFRDCGGGVEAEPASACPPGSQLAGDTNIESDTDSNDAGSAEAFPLVASTSGRAGSVYLYLDAGNAGRTVELGLYTNASGNPGTLIGRATIFNRPNATQGLWVSRQLFGLNGPIDMVAGTTYWLAVLGPLQNAQSGAIHIRDVGSVQGLTSQGSAESHLAHLPVHWTTGNIWGSGSLSAYIAR